MCAIFRKMVDSYNRMILLIEAILKQKDPSLVGVGLLVSLYEGGPGIALNSKVCILTENS